MLIRKAYKFRLEPKDKQRQQMAKNAGCCRFVWNKALALQKEIYEGTGKRYKYEELSSLLTHEWKKDEMMPFLKEACDQPLRQSLRDLKQAYSNAWRRAKNNEIVCTKKRKKGGGFRQPTFEERYGFPVFKKKRIHDSFRYSDHFKFDVNSNDIKLGKIGCVKYRKHREIVAEETVKNVTVSKKGKHWFVSIQVEREIEEPKHPSASAIVATPLGR